MNKSASKKTVVIQGTSELGVTQNLNQNKMLSIPETPREADMSANISRLMPPQDLDDIENNTDKSIDFNSQLEALKQRTETELPHTLT